MSKRTLRHAAWLSILFFAAASIGHAKEFLWEGGGLISVDVPENWSVISKAYGELSYTILATPKSGGKAEMTLSFIQHARKEGDITAELTKRLEQAMTPLLPDSNEKRFSAALLTLRQGVGLMSQLTGEGLRGKLPVKLKHSALRMAFCAIDANCTLIVIMQAEGAESPEAAEMMALLASTTLRRLGRTSILEVTVKDDRYVLSVPISTLSLSMPKGGLVQVSANAGGATQSPRYFYFTDAARRLQVSGWFENEKTYKGIKDFWKAENRGDRLKAKHVSIEKYGDWDVISYETQPLDAVIAGAKGKAVRQTHLRAECARAGTWIDLHCSILSEAPATGDKAALAAFLRSLKVETAETAAAPIPAPQLTPERVAALKAALANLTVNIENVDDRGFATALETLSLSVALAKIEASRLDYPDECLVWWNTRDEHKPAWGLLTAAFASAVLQERLFGDPKLSLHRGWQNVIKYYRHYRSAGSIPKLSPVEKLLKLETKGTLRQEAEKVQAKHPELFDRIEI
jgi:hypothetical protein